MAKKCPPGTICIENFTFLFFGLLILTILIFFYINSNNNTSLLNNSNNKIDNYNYNNNSKGVFPKPSYSFSNVNNDILLNPYSAPLRDDRIFNSDNYNGPKIPINQPTQSIDTNYRQIGILTRVNGGETILPLMGRPLFSNRDKWNFYTMNDKNNMIKLPISFKNKSCTSDQGCDNLYNGDTVYVEGFNDIFRVTIYDNNTMQYIPYL
tara:strand:- start:6 stop:629 length:624 start_codon:yes stop_codon:yes gene_type:complete